MKEVYLVESLGFLKIGSTDNLNKRMGFIKTNNPNPILLSHKKASNYDERNLHILCEKWHYRGEWFHSHPDVIKIFEEYESKQEYLEDTRDKTKYRNKIENRPIRENKLKGKLLQLDMNGNVLKTWNTQLEAAKELGVNNATLHRAIRLGVSCPHKKYFWKYKD